MPKVAFEPSCCVQEIPWKSLISPFLWEPFKHAAYYPCTRPARISRNQTEGTSADGANRSSQAAASPPPPTPEGEGRGEGAAGRTGFPPAPAPQGARGEEARLRRTGSPTHRAGPGRPSSQGGGAQELPESNHGPTRKEGSGEAEGRRRGGPAFSHAPLKEGTRESASRVGTCSASFRGKKTPFTLTLDFSTSSSH